ncbi:MAG: hypothetical protein LUQ01_00545, partial [Methanolinea sp.]|nr:hypothetical protein [Methanolinea sp.]
MIVPMKKATILFEAGDAEATIKNLRRMGVLHIEHHNPPEGRDITVLQEMVGVINSALDLQNQVMAQGREISPQDSIQ